MFIIKMLLNLLIYKKCSIILLTITYYGYTTVYYGLVHNVYYGESMVKCSIPRFNILYLTMDLLQYITSS